MKVKEFFKSNAFKSLAVLLAIVIIAGALLAIFNDLLAVSDEERLARAVAKIYGGTAKVEDPIPVITTGDDKNDEYATGTVNEAYLMSDGNYLVKATGKGGFGGTITAWVVLECKDSKLAGVGKVVYESDKGETLMSKIKSSFYDEFDKHDDAITDGALFWGAGEIDPVLPKPPADELIPNPVSGASKSAGAICNAVNTAILFYKSVILGETIGISPYLHSDWIDLSGFEPEVDKDTKTVTYAMTMVGYGNSPSIKVNITVTEEGITEYSVDGNYLQGMEYGFDGKVDERLLGKEFYSGKTLADLEGYLNKDGEAMKDGSLTVIAPDITTGATHSSSVLIRAAIYALSNYEGYLAKGGNEA